MLLVWVDHDLEVILWYDLSHFGIGRHTSRLAEWWHVLPVGLEGLSVFTKVFPPFSCKAEESEEQQLPDDIKVFLSLRMSQVLSVHQCARQVPVLLVVERAACCCPPQATLEGLRGTAQSTRWPRQRAVHLLDLILVFLMSLVSTGLFARWKYGDWNSFSAASVPICQHKPSSAENAAVGKETSVMEWLLLDLRLTANHPEMAGC